MHIRCTIALLHRLTVGLAAGGLVLAATQAAHAGDKEPDKKTRDKARKAFGDAQKAYEAGDYSGAYKQFKKANDLIPSPHAEYWMAMCLYKQGNKDEAKKALEAFVSSPDATKVGDEKLGDAKKALQELSAADQVPVNVATEPGGASVIVDGEAQMGETPMTLKLAPGKHQLVVSAPSFESKVVDVDVKAGENADQKITLVAKKEAPAPAPAQVAPEKPAPAAPPPAPSAPKAQSKLPAYITLGVAAVGAGVGTYFGIQALKKKSDFDKTPTESLADDTERDALIADMAFGVAVTLGVTGIVLLTSSGDDTAEKPAATLNRSHLAVAPYVSPKGGGAAALLTF